MNLILLFNEDFIGRDHVRLTGRRFIHITTVLNVKIGDELAVGLLNGLMGKAKVKEITSTSLDLDVCLDKPSPVGLALTLIVPMIRPLMFKRLLFHATTLGIKDIYIINFARVEKSLWSSTALHEEAVHEQLVLGLEQAKDTVLPRISIRPQFKPFIEDELPQISHGSIKTLAHPGGQPLFKGQEGQRQTLILGPEGGLVPFEIDSLVKVGFTPIDLGPRILRVDTVLPYIIGKLS